MAVAVHRGAPGACPSSVPLPWASTAWHHQPLNGCRWKEERIAFKPTDRTPSAASPRIPHRFLNKEPFAF